MLLQSRAHRLQREVNSHDVMMIVDDAMTSLYQQWLPPQNDPGIFSIINRYILMIIGNNIDYRFLRRWRDGDCRKRREKEGKREELSETSANNF